MGLIKIKVVILTGEERAFCAWAGLAQELPADLNIVDGLNTEYKPA
jgi:enoyl-CoA hydratase/carnithine racemase